MTREELGVLVCVGLTDEFLTELLCNGQTLDDELGYLDDLEAQMMVNQAWQEKQSAVIQ